MSKDLNKPKKGGLGRGLSALLNNAETDITVSSEYRAGGGVHLIDIADIEANPFQPRTEFEEKALEELSESIKVHGLIQPVTVRKMGYDKYQLISGERRTRASILAGLTKLPAYVRIANDQEMLEMALIENIQRENLNPIEVSLSYKRLLEECSLKQEELGDRVGKDRSTVSNYLRLLRLPEEVQVALRENKISMGHAKAILGVDDTDEQIALFRRIEKENLSVRGAEDIVKQAKSNKGTQNQGKASLPTVFEIDDALKLKVDKLNKSLSTAVNIKPKGNKGEIVIPFKSYEDLERILTSLSEHEEA
ncbi:MAG: ParB/RepB/Spo0J family partition protein [Bacteroidia bacterium]|nr:ParB/RepB/Spo0J family partition protein [Bacteroidia bacterium]